MNRKIISTASVFGMLAVITGAFGAHGLKALLTLTELENWKTAVNYQFYHTLALLFLTTYRSGFKFKNLVYWSFTLGIILFSGSLYLLATRSITGFAISFLGPLTPLGGLFFILGWLGLLISSIKNSNA